MEAPFIPQPWAEDRAPDEAVNCKKCGLCQQRSRVIWGEGNPQAPIMVILDNPGAREDAEGVPFVCGTRQTLQESAHRAGLRTDELYLTYILKCRPLRRYAKDEARGMCMSYLLQQLRQQEPQLVFCLGNTAVQWFFNDMEADVKNLRGVWYRVRGTDAAVSYHPLAVRRRPSLMRLFNEDWQMLADGLISTNYSRKNI